MAPRILVIDDASEYVDFMRMLLTGEGYEVVAAASLAAAEAAAAMPPHLVICDIALPGEPNFAALDLLDREPAFAGVPVIVVSGAVHLLHEERRWRAGRRRALLEKPFEIDTLLSLIDELLEAAPRTPSTDPPAATPPILVVEDDAATRELVRLT